MRKIALFLVVFLFIGALGFGADNAEKKLIGLIVPVINGKKSATGQYYPLYEQKANPKILFYVEPMEGKAMSYTPKKDGMGMDYIPYYVDEKSMKVIYYLEPMEKKIKSATPKKDGMGMDYIPVYEARVYSK